MRKRMICLWIVGMALLPAGCATQEKTAEPAPTVMATQEVSWPKDKLELNDNGVPTLAVYVVEKKQTANESIEAYLEGVLAGEMKNDWPVEALKAQAILARTYALKFVDEKESQYKGADISTDIEEAQAYNPEAINDRIRQAVAETRGMVLVSGGELPYAWFHAHSGGMTERAREGLGWNKDEPAYTTVVKSNEPTPAELPEEPALAEAAEWEADFTFAELEAAAAKQGKKITVKDSDTLAIDERGQSGRAVTLIFGETTLNASSLRIALGSTKMRSTLLTSLRLSGDTVHMAGRGYGHGVGMSQWGAYGMAREGKKAEDIVKHFFEVVEVTKLW